MQMRALSFCLEQSHFQSDGANPRSFHGFLLFRPRILVLKCPKFFIFFMAYHVTTSCHKLHGNTITVESWGTCYQHGEVAECMADLGIKGKDSTEKKDTGFDFSFSKLPAC